MVNEMRLPQHIAIVMDGNGRWAKSRHLPRAIGHKKGINSTRRVVKLCGDYGIPFLTLFAFSTENWSRPAEEIDQLLTLMMNGLKKEVPELHKNGVKVHFVGDLSRFEPKLQQQIAIAQEHTKNNTRLTLSICINYGGRWDIVQAANAVIEKKWTKGQKFEIDEHELAECLSLPDSPPPDLFIRTSGEQRISNFLLWQLAYTELYFTEKYWPDFNKAEFDKALQAFSKRQRRFGKVD